ncbi:histidine phosphatase family protein [Lapidilactobacillus wuchangensis]|uniref:histidine phosphatase family protein n=1 Tax=Lapidilactobacillus wuchangensis TaxID=2486001 RepID=UPI0013DD9256|nr:histidine phosphatase family protein [Lapidilactobacillus wuchangensis]
MTKLFIVRHGETENNRLNLMNGGSVDSPLTEKGVSGAKKLGQFLKDQPFDHAYVSPQQRAQTTLELMLAERQQPVATTVLEDLREFNMGRWDGQPIATLPQGKLLDDYLHHPDRYDATLTGGESYQHLVDRGRRAFDQIVQAYPQGNILVVAHGVVLRATLNYLQGTPLSKIRDGVSLVNTSVSEFSATTINGKITYHCDHWNQLPPAASTIR